jgi:4'-phosphopantetheinyl transferase
MTPRMAVADVHLWRCALDLPSEEGESLASLLSAEERLRVSRLRFERDRGRKAAARGWLKRLAGEYVGAPAESIRIAPRPDGKPALVGDGSAGWLRFNVSDSDGVAVYAFADGREVGVDVERLREDLGAEEASALAARFFAPNERRRIEAAAPANRARELLRHWTAKEAYLKARGDCLEVPPETFAVGFGPEGEAFLEEPPPEVEPDEEGRWRFRTFETADGFVGAVVVERPLDLLIGFDTGRFDTGRFETGRFDAGEAAS